MLIKSKHNSSLVNLEMVTHINFFNVQVENKWCLVFYFRSVELEVWKYDNREDCWYDYNRIISQHTFEL